MRRWVVILGVVVLGGCSNEGTPPSSTGDGAGRDSGEGLTELDCSRPNAGCVCLAGAASTDCFTGPSADGTCGLGTRHCLGSGVWGLCENIHEIEIDPSVHWAALIDGPGACNPCDPDCNVARDYPNDTDLNPGNSSGVNYDPGAGGIVITPTMGVPPLVDTDGDGIPDVADDCVGPGWQLPCDGSASDDGYYHTLAFGDPPALDPLIIMTQVRAADVYFLVDTTGSMGGELTNLKNDLTSGTFLAGCSGGIIGAIQCTIPDAWYGVGGFDDYPLSPYGSSAVDDVYYHLQDIASSAAASQTAVNTLSLHSGWDWPESQSQALYAVASGNGLGPYLPARTGCPGGTFGYPCWRSGVIPIVVMFTDAPFHNGPNAIYNYGAFGGGGALVLPPPTAVAGNDGAPPTPATTAHNMGDLTGNWVGFSGNTCSLTNWWNMGCADGAREAAFQFTVSTAGTYTFTLEGSSYDTVIGLIDGTFSWVLACNDDYPGLGLQSRIDVALTPGTYYLLVDGFSTNCGSYQLTAGQIPAPPPASYPVTWAQAINELNVRGIRTIIVNSGGAGTDAENDSIALANATGTVDSSGNPFVFNISSAGTGLSTAVVTAIQDIANYSRMDVAGRANDDPSTPAVDERCFVTAINAISYPPGRCTGQTATTFLQCLPGTDLDFEVTFENNCVMPTAVPQIFDFTIDVVGDGLFILDTYPVRIVVPPNVPLLPPTGTYSRDYDATARCDIPPERPDWGDFTWTAVTPPDSYIEFQFQTANTIAGLGAAAPVSFNVPPTVPTIDIGDLLIAGGEPNLLPYLRVTSVLHASTDLMTSPTLTGFELQWICAAGE